MARGRTGEVGVSVCRAKLGSTCRIRFFFKACSVELACRLSRRRPDGLLYMDDHTLVGSRLMIVPACRLAVEQGTEWFGHL